MVLDLNKCKYTTTIFSAFNHYLPSNKFLLKNTLARPIGAVLSFETVIR